MWNILTSHSQHLQQAEQQFFILQATSIGFHGNIVIVWEALVEEFERTGEILVELGSDQTSCHNPFNGGYYPIQLNFEEAQEVSLIISSWSSIYYCGFQGSLFNMAAFTSVFVYWMGCDTKSQLQILRHKICNSPSRFATVHCVPPIEILSKHLIQSQWGKIQTEAQRGEGLNPLLTLSNTLVRNLVVTKFTQPCPFVTIFLADKSLH